MLAKLAALRKAASLEGGGTSDFDLNYALGPPPRREATPAAVLVPVIAGSAEPAVVLTRRSSKLRNHPGQIAFPGGRVEESDGTVVSAALREAREEVGLVEGHVEILGVMPPHVTVTGFSVTPVVGLVRGEFIPVPQKGEVEEVFEVPLSHVTSLDNFSIHFRWWNGSRRYFYAVPYGGYYIWGATARILRGLAERMAVALP